MTSQPHCLKKTSSMQSKRYDLHHTRLHRETNEKLSFYCYSPQWITTTFFYDNQPTRRLSAEVLFPLEENSCSNQRKKVTTNINNSKTNCKRLIKKIGIYEVSTRSNTTQVNNAFCACWLASSEVNSKYYLLPIFFPIYVVNAETIIHLSIVESGRYLPMVYGTVIIHLCSTPL